MFKQVLTIALSIMSFTGVAHAQGQYVAPLNAGLGNGASVSCGACHTDGGSKSSATLPMAGTWRSGANLALSDSDGDGFNNAQEVSGGSTNFNYASISPFTMAKSAESSTSSSVVVTGAGIVTETAITDTYTQAGITLPVDYEVAGNVSPLVPTFPATITFNKGVGTGSLLYSVDLVNKTNTPITSGVTFNKNGSITVSGVAANSNIVVLRKTPVVPAAGAPRGGEEEEFECMTSLLPSSVLMFLSLMGLGLLVRRKA